jgi:membrane-bound lytic murein transglycosylase D
MSGTARILGLSNRQRFEMAASTKAALLHLKGLYKEFGNWELAIAAYNAGDGRVNSALNRNPHAKTVQELRLPHETRQYVLAFFQLQNALKGYDLT